MRPRFLRYLRVNDEPPLVRNDLVLQLPVTTEDLTRWLDFCKDVANQKLWDFELMTIDFNFRSDDSTPWFPFLGQDPNIYNADFLSDSLLRGLRWSDRLKEI